MKKIGIITLQGDNYGATLQAVALNKKLNDLGYDAENLDYNDKKRVLSGLSLKGRVKFFLRQKVIIPILIGNKRKKNFNAFRKNYLKLSSDRWDSKEKLAQNPPQYDVYISGSDQIWNPDVINNDYNYLLAFAPDESKKIAYASSFGKAEISEDKYDIYKHYLSRYNHLAVRENSGQKLVEKLTGRSCYTVVDPTLLLTEQEWSEMASAQKDTEPYILCYYMPGDKLVCDAICKIATALSKKTGKKVINLGLKEHYVLKPGLDFRATAGPAEFISLFLNADCIVTNSFHGTAFATNFNKQLYVPINSKILGKGARHTRMIDYLNLIELSDAIVLVDENFTFSEHSLDYTKPRENIIKNREASINYLLNSINS